MKAPHPAYPWQPKANQWPSLAETRPKDSWWLNAKSREELDALAAANLNRMRWSPYGVQSQFGLHGIDAPPPIKRVDTRGKHR